MLTLNTKHIVFYLFLFSRHVFRLPCFIARWMSRSGAFALHSVNAHSSYFKAFARG